MIKKVDSILKWIKKVSENESKVLSRNGYNGSNEIGAEMFEDLILYEYDKDGSMGFIGYVYRDKDVYVPSYALYAEGKDIDLVLYELYTFVSKKWVLDGYCKHVIDCVNIPEYNDSLMQLGFSYEQAYAILSIDEQSFFASDLSIRMLSQDDSKLLRRMADIIYSFQNKAPVFADASEENVKSIRDGFQGLISDDEVLFYIAESSEPMAYAGLWENEEEYLLPKGSVELTVVGTFEEYSSKGIGTKLIHYVMNDLKNKGYKWVTTDWRVTNIKSRRFWKDKCNFQVTKNRMIRMLPSSYEFFDFSK